MVVISTGMVTLRLCQSCGSGQARVFGPIASKAVIVGCAVMVERSQNHRCGVTVQIARQHGERFAKIRPRNACHLVCAPLRVLTVAKR